MQHCAKDIEQLFFDTFFKRYQTRLIGGAAEPLYQPANNENEHHQLYYREDYFASSLHEIAHWCIAGDKRRTQIDFGYWYAPEGRDKEQQKSFEAVEVQPQALEWMFSQAAQYPFRLSVDNFAEPNYQSPSFAKAVQQCCINWCEEGLPKRGEAFINVLQTFYKTTPIIKKQNFCELPN